MARVQGREDIKNFLISSEALHIEPIVEFWQIDTVRNSLQFVEDISKYIDIEGSYVSRSGYEPMGGRAHLRIQGEHNYEKYLIYIRANIYNVKGDYIHTELGMYIPKVPKSTIVSQISYNVDCVDILNLLNSDMRVSFSTRKDEAAGEVLRRAYSLSGCALSTSFPLIDFIFTDERGEVWLASDEITWLECLNDILRSTGNIGLYSNRRGIVESRPYYFLNEHSPVWEFTHSSGVAVGTEVQENFWEIPNRWTGIADQLKFEDNLTESEYTISNVREGITSYESIGRWVDRVFSADVRTRKGLEDSVRWQAQLDRQLSLRLSISHSINPLFWVGDVVSIKLPSIVSGNPKGVVSSWTLSFDSELMDIEVEVPV